MTHFNFSAFNHSGDGADSLHDLIVIMAAQLLDLGHDVHVNLNALMDPPVVNLIYEMSYPAFLPFMDDCHRRGLRFICIATERAGPDGFYGTKFKDSLRTRARLFQSAHQHCEAVWTLQPDSLAWYEARHHNVHLIELGYSERLIQPARGPSYDFCAYGGKTVYREAQIAKLRRHATVLEPPPNPSGSIFMPPKQRNELIQQAKVVLNLKQEPDWFTISSSRCATSLHCGRPVFSEQVDCQSAWNSILTFETSPETFELDALGMLKDWEAHYARQMSAFKELLSPEKCLGEAVRAIR